MKRIEITSINGNVLFSHEEENNTWKRTVELANLYSVNLSGADLSALNLSGANLRGANLRGANLSGATLFRADLSFANLRDARLLTANLSGATLRRTTLCGADLRGTTLCDANMRGANMRGANIRSATLSGVYLSGAYISGVIIGKDSFGANLYINDVGCICIVGPIGSRLDYTTAYKTDKGIYIKCGCFFGTIEDFEKAVEDTHKGNEYEKPYKELIRFISSLFHG